MRTILSKTRPPLWGKWRAIRQKPSSGYKPQPGETDAEAEAEASAAPETPETRDLGEADLQPQPPQLSPPPPPPPRHFALDTKPTNSTLLDFRRDGNTIIREFPTWNSFIHCAIDRSLGQWSLSRKGSLHNDPSRWSGTASLSEAVDLALRGWPEGRRNLFDALAHSRPITVPHRSVNYDVGGAFPMVPIAIAGDPACMVDFFNETLAARPIVRIDVANGGGWTIDAATFANRGAAVLSLARDLEAQGKSTELRLAIYIKGDRENLEVSIVYKKAGEFLDLDRAAFALSHASVLRRFVLLIAEQHPELERSLGPHYGSPRAHPPSDPHTIYISPATCNQDSTAARKSVEAAFEAVLNPKREKAYA